MFKAVDDFLEQCMENNVTVISQQVFLYDPLTQVQKLKVTCSSLTDYFSY